MGSDCAIIPMNNKNRIMRSGFFMGRGGFEPPKQVAADLQSVPFGHSGICPFRQGIALTLRKYTIFTLFTQVLIPLIFTQPIFIHYPINYSGIQSLSAKYITQHSIRRAAPSPLPGKRFHKKCRNSFNRSGGDRVVSFVGFDTPRPTVRGRKIALKLFSSS